jgi:O-antigen/teichoic acid export membrane protein
MMQALLSAANFAVGLLLVRRTTDEQYAYYVLATNAVLLFMQLQTSLLQPYAVSSLTRLPTNGARDVVGGLIRVHTRWVPVLCGGAIAIVGGLWLFGRFAGSSTMLLMAFFAAVATAMGRELYRTILFAYRRGTDVLGADALYVTVLVAGAFVATWSAEPAAVALLFVAIAALTARRRLRGRLHRAEPWNIHGAPDTVRRLADNGLWAVGGSAIHWALTMGYGYLTAAFLGVKDVAALAATRLTLMPLFVLSGGIGMLMLPITSSWVHRLGAGAAARRLGLMVTALLSAAVCYMAATWVVRDWIFGTLMKKQFEHRDELLLLWSILFLIAIARDHLATLAGARDRWRAMTLLIGAGAILSVVTSVFAIRLMGSPGAVVAIIAGESVSLIGTVLIVVFETRDPAMASRTS